MILDREQIEHLRKAQESAAKAYAEFMLARVPVMTVSNSEEVGSALSLARDVLTDILKNHGSGRRD